MEASSLGGLRHRDPKRRKSAAAEQLERFQPAVEPDIVAAILDDLTGVRDRGAVAAKHPADGFKTHFETDMREIHRDLAREGRARRAPHRREQLGKLEAEITGHAE